MKKILITLLMLLVIVTCSKSPQELNWIKGDYKSVHTDGKIIMLDLWSPSCGPCIKYNKTTFKDSDVIKFVDENFQSYKYDVWIDENIEIFRKFVKDGIPLIVFLDKDLNEIDRISRYLGPAEFLSELKRIRSGINTFKSVKTSYENNKTDLNKLFQYAEKLDKKEGPFNPEVMKLYSEYINKSRTNTYKSDFAKYRLAYAKMYVEKNEKPLMEFTRVIQYRDFLVIGMEKIAQYLKEQNDYESLIKYYNSVLEIIYNNISKHKDYRYVKYLNDVAWDLYQTKQKPELQLETIKFVIDHSNKNGGDNSDIANYYDTYARILLSQEKTDFALKAVNTGLKLNPESKDLADTKNLIQSKM